MMTVTIVLPTVQIPEIWNLYLTQPYWNGTLTWAAKEFKLI